MWVKRSGGNADDENFYATSVRRLLTAGSEEDYSKLVAEYSECWSPAFGEYYEETLKPAVLASAEFCIRTLDVATFPYIGVTNNVSESFNRVLKDFQNWKVNIVLRLCSDHLACLLLCT